MSAEANSSYTLPDNLWKVNRTLHFDEPLDANDPRWVDTGAARGAYTRRPFYRALGVRETETSGAPRLELMGPPDRGYYLFCGHRGCGKSTELRRIRQDLHGRELYYVVFADAAQDLDVNNLRYQDILLHLAAKLAGQLEEDKIEVDQKYVARLEDWFNDRVAVQEETREFANQAVVGANSPWKKSADSGRSGRSEWL